MIFLRDFEFPSSALNDHRMVTVFAPNAKGPSADSPVVFCADGHAVSAFAAGVSREIESGNLPDVTLIGAHSSTRRSQEYVPGIDRIRFQAHEQFFVDELTTWAASEFGIHLRASSCGIFGLSHGGAFAVTTGTRHSHRFGVVIAFSIPSMPTEFVKALDNDQPLPRYYLAAGSREQGCRHSTAAIASILKKRNAACEHAKPAGRHDLRLWSSELSKALKWSFPFDQGGSGLPPGS